MDTTISRLPVVCFGLGPIGTSIAQCLSGRDDIEIVAAVDIDPLKQGKDLFAFFDDASSGNGTEPIRIRSELPQRLAGSTPGVLVHATSSGLEQVAPQLNAAIDSGWNVVSTCEELNFPRATNPEMAKRLDDAARKANISILGAGINPGFLLDALVLTLTAVCTQVESISVRRVVDTNKRRLPLQRKAGVGLSEQAFRQLMARNSIGHVGLRQSAYLVADQLRWQIDGYEETLEPVIAESGTVTEVGPVQPGDVLGQRQTASLWSRGVQVLRYELQMSAGVAEVDSISIKGTPSFHQVIEGGINGDVGTQATIANLVPLLPGAPSGLLTMADILPLCCRDTRPVRKVLSAVIEK